MSKPWKDWIPGVLSKEQIQELCADGRIENVVNWNSDDEDKNPIDYSAIDLTLTDEGYLLTKGSVKPFGDRYIHFNKSNGLVERLPRGEDYELKRSNTYLFKLREKLSFTDPKEAKIYGQATAKSTIGRMDVLARLIVDGMDVYEGFNPDGLAKGSGEMYLEITPMTFHVRVKEGISLSQLRLFRGKPENAEIKGEEVYEPLLHCKDGGEMDGSLSVDLQGTQISKNNVCAFCANPMGEGDEPINLWEREHYEPHQYWKFKTIDENGRLKIDKTHFFYILRSKELISLPDNVAVYCRAIDEAIGEMRIHYAGFVHPFFGKGRDTDDSLGTCLIFEVRGHDVDVSLKDGEKMARLTFYHLSRPCKRGKSSYNEQTLQLSKIFADWPDEIEVGEDGSVKKAETAKK
jgi:dCTP deaminase